MDPEKGRSTRSRLADQIAKSYGYRTPVVLRTAEQLGEVIRGNPFLGSGEAEES
ncbi:MAG: DUF1697 domain-containing protein [Isosphaeraceae bacterium]